MSDHGEGEESQELGNVAANRGGEEGEEATRGSLEGGGGGTSRKNRFLFFWGGGFFTYSHFSRSLEEYTLEV